MDDPHADGTITHPDERKERAVPHSPTPVSVARGDGIGPEITDAVLELLHAAGAQLDICEITLGAAAYDAGHDDGLPPAAIEQIERTRLLLKAPLATPSGGGYRSVNVAIRKRFGLFANVRPVTALHPAVATRHPDLDLVIVRENTEDLYAGLEYQPTADTAVGLKVATTSASERIVRYAFDYARANGRRKVTAMSKPNILKLTDGAFVAAFDKVATDYPDIDADHLIIDIATARLADTPEHFDVIVAPNLFGDILSDVAAQLSGSVGLAPSANIGTTVAMFEAVHGTAPDIAGGGIANPSGLLLAAIQMLAYAGQPAVAARLHAAWLTTLEAGIHTGDIYRDTTSARRVGTSEFAAAVVDRLGETPERLPAAAATVWPTPTTPHLAASSARTLVGVDVYVHARDGRQLADELTRLDVAPWTLDAVVARGVRIWPEALAAPDATDLWQARYTADGADVRGVADLLARLAAAGVEFVRTEQLYRHGDVDGFAPA